MIKYPVLHHIRKTIQLPYDLKWAVWANTNYLETPNGNRKLTISQGNGKIEIYQGERWHSNRYHSLIIVDIADPNCIQTLLNAIIKTIPQTQILQSIES